jgi:hypothetical protein
MMGLLPLFISGTFREMNQRRLAYSVDTSSSPEMLQVQSLLHDNSESSTKQWLGEHSPLGTTPTRIWSSM